MVKGHLPDVRIPDVTVHGLAFNKFREHGNKSAIVDATSGRSYTYSDLLRMCKSFASGLTKLGAKKGDVLAIFTANSIEYPVVMLGTMAAGVIPTTVNPAYTKHELAKQLKDSRARFMYATRDLHALAAEAAKLAGNVQHIIVDGDSRHCVDYQTLVNDDGSAFPASMTFDPTNDVAIIPYSSGTTGVPKGVMLTHTNIVSNHFMINNFEDLLPPLVRKYQSEHPGHPTVVLGLLPFYHIYGITGIMLNNLYQGYKVVSLPKFVPDTFLLAIQNYKIQVLYLVPPLIIFLLKTPLLDQYNLSSVLLLVSGAAPLTKEVVQQVQQRTGAQVLQGYGLTETSPATTYPYFKAGFIIPEGSVGTPLSNTEFQVVDVVSGRVKGAKEEGEIWIRGPQIMKGYLNRPDATRDTVDGQGWLHTGDIGYYDEKHNFFITGRLKELIKYKAFQVAPAELEGVLLEHAGIADAGVVGIADEAAGELPKAFIVRKPGQQLSVEDVHKHCREQLTDYKQLRGGVQFVAEIPKTASGKILRRELQRLHKTDTPTKSRL